MRRFFSITMFLCLCAVGIQAQTAVTDPPTTAGNVCRVTNYRTKPGKGDEFTKFRREHTKPIFDEQLKQGLILSYSFFTQPTNDGPDDWDLAQVVCYKNYADAIDFNPERTAKFLAIAVKHYGSDEARIKANDSLRDLRDVLSSDLIREQKLNPIK